MDRWTYALFFFSHLFETFFQDSSEQKPNFIFNESIIKYSIFIILTKLILNEIKFKSSFWLLISDNWIDSWKSLTEWCVFLTENVEASSLEGHVVGGYDVPVRGQV